MAGPLYREIAEDLRRMIDSGQLGQGVQLPTEDELMELHSASRNTVRNAIKELSMRGLVYTLHGKGTFVTEQVNPIVTTLTTDPTTGGGGGEGRVYTAEVAASGRRPPRVFLKSRCRRPIRQLPTRYGFRREPISSAATRSGSWTDDPGRCRPRSIPGRLRIGLRDSWARTTSKKAPWLTCGQCGIKQAGYRDSIEVRRPDPRETEFFGLRLDGRIEVVEIYRVAFDQDQNRVRLTITVYRADRNRFVINIGEVPPSEGLLPGNGGSMKCQ